MSPDLASGFYIIGGNGFSRSSLPDGKGVSIGHHYGSVAAADGTAPQKWQSILGPIGPDRYLTIVAILAGTTEISPIGVLAGFYLDRDIQGCQT